LIALDPAKGEPDCKFTETYLDDKGVTVSKPVPSCADAGDTPPCWKLTPGAGACQGRIISVSVDPDPATITARVTYDCAKCTTPDPATGCP
jgi:hypothetical protein